MPFPRMISSILLSYFLERNGAEKPGYVSPKKTRETLKPHLFLGALTEGWLNA